MDPNTAGPEEYGHDGDGHQGRDSRDAQARAAGRRSPRDSLTADFGQHAPAPARTARIVAGEFLLTVNPVDGSEIENRPPQEHPGRPAKYTAARRSESERAARPPVPPGSALPDSGLLQRDEERDRLVGLLARGRSVRLVGAPGSGRTVLLDAVAVDCADLAPDGVVRLSGHRRTVDDLMGDLYHAVFDAPEYRPGRDELREALAEIGAVVLLDDLEFGGAALDELLDATPECAYLCAVTPDVPAPSAEAAFEDVALGGLDRAGCVELLERAVGRVLTEEESNWAGDLLFESEGLPLRFKQAGALLRQRDRLRLEAEAFDEYGVFEDAKAEAATVRDTVPESVTGDEEPLPPLAEAAAAAPLLASRLSRSARETLRFAVALDGEVPHLTHLPALVDDTHADAALAELAGCALVTPVGARYRLAAGVLAQLVAAGYDTDAEEHLLTAARHYAWWAGHPSVTPERVAAEADAVLAALTALVPLTTPVDENSEAAEDTAEPEGRGGAGAARRRAARPAGRARVRRRAALGRLGAGAAGRCGGLAAGGGGGRPGVLPPRAGRPRALRGPVGPGPGRAGDVRRTARRGRRPAGDRRGAARPGAGRRPGGHRIGHGAGPGVRRRLRRVAGRAGGRGTGHGGFGGVAPGGRHRDPGVVPGGRGTAAGVGSGGRRRRRGRYRRAPAGRVALSGARHPAQSRGRGGGGAARGRARHGGDARRNLRQQPQRERALRAGRGRPLDRPGQRGRQPGRGQDEEGRRRGWGAGRAQVGGAVGSRAGRDVRDGGRSVADGVVLAFGDAVGVDDGEGARRGRQGGRWGREDVVGVDAVLEASEVLDACGVADTVEHGSELAGVAVGDGLRGSGHDELGVGVV
ncbi:ATP-binding protein [Streptomyces sp. B3I8]|uniref:ATP-binding protein n=1 Tax=Streptomyces sp. B3I8 TaxID=3042303 RepID=UPI00278027ED|nr:hypothetical protein [Streptomyces sp. B3I8]